MAGTFPFSRTVLTPGTHDLGQAPLALGDSGLLLSVDRAIAGGLDSVPVSTTLQLIASVSEDSGATWQMAMACGTNGGQFIDKHGVPYPATTVSGTLPDPQTARLIKASVTIVGSSVAVSGSITVT